MRLFTVAEANALIPRLEDIFGELQGIREQAKPTQEALAGLEHKTRSNGADHTTELRDLRTRLDALIEKINARLQEISALGCEVKDIDQGLVDFPYQREGHIVYLCWKRGEDRIRFWHETSTGFAGRQPLERDEC